MGLVEASFAFLLERETKESILREFDLIVIGRYFPDYEREIGHRLTRQLVERPRLWPCSSRCGESSIGTGCREEGTNGPLPQAFRLSTLRGAGRSARIHPRQAEWRLHAALPDSLDDGRRADGGGLF